MADPLGIIGVIAVAGHILHLTVRLGIDWKDAPEDAKSFLNEIQTLKTVLSETHTNIIVNEDFNAAFEGRRSALLLELDDATQSTSTFSLVETCKQQLYSLLSDLKKRTQGHRLGWERLKGAFTNKKTTETVEDLHRRCQSLNGLISLDALSLGVETHKEVKQARKEQRDWQGEQKSKEILDWLSNADYYAQQSDFLRRRQAGTGQWLLDSQEYQQWVATPQTTLFCPGIPGAGKTMLTSMVVDDLQNRFRDDGNVSIAYLYCNFRRQAEQTVESLLSSVLRQLAQNQPSLPECVQALHDACGRQKPTLGRLSHTLQLLVKTLPKVFIIVDALDECQLTDGSRARFLDEIFALQSGSKANLFATSRFIMDITDRFTDATFLEIRAHEEDVRRYLAGNISQLPACVAKNPELQEEIMTKIVEAVDGMFLLAQLHLNSLKGKRSAKIIRAALGTLHSGSGAYDKAYDDAMERIAGQLEDQEELAKQVLMWITCAVRPLEKVELQIALAVELGESEFDLENVPEIEDIVSVCSGLVTVDDESNIIRLVHYTTQEYFSRTSARWFPDAGCNITETCITYLSFDLFEIDNFTNMKDDVFERMRRSFAFFYAFEHWVDHASMTESEQCEEMVSNLIFSRSSTTQNKSKHWKRRFGHRLASRVESLGRNEITTACRRGQTGHVQYLLQRGSLLNELDIEGKSPLSTAVNFRQHSTVQVLLDLKDINVNLQDIHGRTSLFYALENGDQTMVETLLSTEGIDTAVILPSGETLLHAAASGGLEDIFKMFLGVAHNSGKLNAQDGSGRTPLHFAAKYGHVALVRLLLESDGIDIRTKAIHMDETPLHKAVENGHRDVIHMLLSFDATAIQAKTRLGETPLYLAAHFGHEFAVRAILDVNATAIKTIDNRGRTPLHTAVGNGHEAVVQLLHSFDVTAIRAKDGSGATPLHLAVKSGFEDAIHMLLNMNGVEINARNHEGSTLLHEAVQYRNVQILQLLLNTEARLMVNDANYAGQTPMMVAARSGKEDLVQFLLSVDGINLDHVDIHGNTLLHHAAEGLDPAPMKTLVALGRFDINQRNKTGKTPLLAAIIRRRWKMVKILLGMDGIEKSLTLGDEEGRTPLSVAAEEVRRPQSVAVKKGRAEVVELLKELHKKFGV